jgi:cell division protein FtsQ
VAPTRSAGADGTAATARATPRPTTPATSRPTTRTDAGTQAGATTAAGPGGSGGPGSWGARLGTSVRASARDVGRRVPGRRAAGTTSPAVGIDPALPVAVPGAPAAGASAGLRDARDGLAPRGLHALSRSRVSTGSVRRFADRARRRRLLTWRPLAVAAGVLAVLVLAGWVVWFSPLLAAREVQLVGAQRVTQEEVDAAVAAELGRPLSRLDADAVRGRLAVLPEVRSVQVLRVWPSTVEVRVTEREPVAAVPDGSAFSLVDADGVQVEQVAAPPAGLPVVSAETVAAGDAALLAAAQVLEALPPVLADQVTGTTAATPDSVVLTLASSAQVVWGSPDESDRKAAVLQVLLATPAEVYDVSAPGTPVTR